MPENVISLYHMGYQICTGLAVNFLLLTVFLFFKFKIPALFFIRSGRAMRKTIKEIEANHAKTGRMKSPQEMAGREEFSALEATDVLHNEEKTMPIRFVIEKNMILIHSDEEIF